jgi:hypothetical protein
MDVCIAAAMVYFGGENISVYQTDIFFPPFSFSMFPPPPFFLWIYVCVCVCVFKYDIQHTYIRTYIHTHIHTHIHTYIRARTHTHNTHTQVLGLLFSILAGNAYSVLYQQQESIYLALFQVSFAYILGLFCPYTRSLLCQQKDFIYFALLQEVSEAKSLLEQTALIGVANVLLMCC